MYIVPAGMHYTGLLRFVSDIILLIDRQRIHIGAQSDASDFGFWILDFGINHANYSEAAYMGFVRNSPLRKFLGNECCCFFLLKGKLRMRVNVMADGNDFVTDFVSARFDLLQCFHFHH